MAEIEKIGNVFYKVTDMNDGVDFYQRVLGLQLKFRDGDNWAAFDVAGVTLALEPALGALSGNGGATVSLRVKDLDGLAGELRGRGAKLGDITMGGHERKLDITDPSGNHVLLYEPFPHP